jgi:hypothetical protein
MNLNITSPISFLTIASFSGLLLSKYTLSPFRASSIAYAFPIPSVAPVITKWEKNFYFSLEFLPFSTHQPIFQAISNQLQVQALSQSDADK